MELKDLIKANSFLIEDYKNIKKENELLKKENESLKEKLNNKKRKFEELEEDKEESKKEEENKKSKKPKVVNYMIGSTVEYIISKVYHEYNNFDSLFNKKSINMEFVETHFQLFEKLKDYYNSLIYIGNNNHKYDFKSITFKSDNSENSDFKSITFKSDNSENSDFKYINKEKEEYVSVKSNFTGKKVCPQIIGQTTLNKYKSYFDLNNILNIENVKSYIVTHIDTILQKYLLNTFHCDIIYFNIHKQKVNLQIIKYNETLLNNFIFKKEDIYFSHIQNNKEWIESTTVYYIFNKIMVPIGEFQIHNNRDTIKFRWHFDKIIKICGFESIDL